MFGFNEVERCAKPLIAAVSGFSLTGGFELALYCDMRIATRGSVFSLPEPRRGLVPVVGLSYDTQAGARHRPPPAADSRDCRMRPSPAEVLAGIRRILKDVIAPEIGSELARLRLAEIRAVLAQVDWNNVALHDLYLSE